MLYHLATAYSLQAAFLHVNADTEEYLRRLVSITNQSNPPGLGKIVCTRLHFEVHRNCYAGGWW